MRVQSIQQIAYRNSAATTKISDLAVWYRSGAWISLIGHSKTWNHDCGMNGSSNDISVCEHLDLKWCQGLVIRESQEPFCGHEFDS